MAAMDDGDDLDRVKLSYRPTRLHGGGYSGDLLSRLKERETNARFQPYTFRRTQAQNFDLTSRLTLAVKGQLDSHQGCVNTALFNESGTIIASGSDDRTIKLWDVASRRLTLTINSGHRGNVFCARFMPHSNDRIMVSCAADGQVRVHRIPYTGREITSKEVSSKLASRHSGRAHKLALEPDSAHCFYSCGEDGYVRIYDLRDFTTNVLTELPGCGLNAIIVNPLEPHTFVVGGNDAVVHQYDARRPAHSVRKYVPQHMLVESHRTPHVTGLAYNKRGTEIVATYNDEDIYRFRAERSGDPAPPARRMDVAAAHRAADEEASEAEASAAAEAGPAPAGFVGPMPAATATAMEISAEASRDSTDERAERVALEARTAPATRGGAYDGADERLFGDAAMPDADREAEEQEQEEDVEREGEDERDWHMADDEPRRRRSLAQYGEVLSKFQGHRNRRTVKSVSFYGATDEFVVSGSDCGNIFVWHKEGVLATMMKGDEDVVNSLDPHPLGQPMLVTSGIENNVKIWEPIGERFDGARRRQATQQMEKNLSSRRRGGNGQENPRNRAVLAMLMRYAMEQGGQLGVVEGEDGNPRLVFIPNDGGGPQELGGLSDDDDSD